MNTASLPPVTDARVSFSYGSAILLSLLTILVCVSLIVGRTKMDVEIKEVPTRIGPSGSIGDMSAKEAEEAYGPVNHTAAIEPKEGIRDRIALRRASRGYYVYTPRAVSRVVVVQEVDAQVSTPEAPACTGPSCSLSRALINIKPSK